MDALTRYSDIFIPLGVSVLGAFISFQVYKFKVDRLIDDVSDMENEVKLIRDKIIACEAIVAERAPLKKSKSPVSLTDRGEKVLAESGGRLYVETNYSELKEKIESQAPTNPYDVQEVAHKVAMDLNVDARIETIKNYAFKEGLELGDILDVMGIYLRDKILSDKGWKSEDIDKKV